MTDIILSPVQTGHVILLADDNENDRFLLRRAFQRLGVANPVREVKSGAEVMAYLEGEGLYSDRTEYPFPSILLLDLHMPDGDGFQVLNRIRNKLVAGGFLIIVLSRLDEIKNINRAYALGAHSFLSKPGNETELQDLIHSFNDYWIVRNRRPSEDVAG